MEIVAVVLHLLVLKSMVKKDQCFKLFLQYRYTGADITAVVREAGLAAMTENLESQFVAERHFLQALKVVCFSYDAKPPQRDKVKARSKPSEEELLMPLSLAAQIGRNTVMLRCSTSGVF